jgi:hypothetical protein
MGCGLPIEPANTQGNWVACCYYAMIIYKYNLIVTRLTNMRVCICQKLTLFFGGKYFYLSVS